METDNLTVAGQFVFTGGLPETPCGYGSTIELTEHIRLVLPEFLASWSITSVLDAPCGDFNWMAETDLSGVDYIGCDVNADHLEVARLKSARMKPKFRPQSSRFIELDISREPLPFADVMVCRDFLQHLPFSEVYVIVRNFLKSQIPWMLVTSFDNETNEDIERPGMFRELNLNAAPFGFPHSTASISDPPGSGRSLCLWNRQSLLLSSI